MVIYIDRTNVEGGIIKIGKNIYKYRAFSILPGKLIIYYGEKTIIPLPNKHRIYQGGTLINYNSNVKNRFYKRYATNNTQIAGFEKYL